MIDPTKQTNSRPQKSLQPIKGADSRVAGQTQSSACTDYADRLIDWSDGELSPEEREPVAAHIATCAGCRAELARLDASLALLTSGIESDTGGRGSRRAVELRKKTGSAGALPSRLRSVAAIAAVGLVCAVSGWLISQRKPTIAQPDRVAQMQPAAEPSPAPKITRDDALWHIALLEQQARLQASLELMPHDESYADQRRQNERLLAKYQIMAAGAQPRDFQ
jgi:hypothetical protein